MAVRKPLSVLRHESSSMAFSAETQAAAVAEWRARAQRDSEVLSRITSRIKTHKKSAEANKLRGRWLAERAALERETASSQLEYDKAWAKISNLVPEPVVVEQGVCERKWLELLNSFRAPIADIRRECSVVRQRPDTITREDVVALRTELSNFRNELSEAIKAAEREMESVSETEETERDFPIDVLRGMIQSSMESFTTISESRVGKPNKQLVDIYRNALEDEGNNVINQLEACRSGKRSATEWGMDLRKVSMILKTYGSASMGDAETPVLPRDIYDRVQQSMPGVSLESVRAAVDEVVRQKQERLLVRSLTLQYKRRSSELLRSFEKALVADEEIAKVVNCMCEEARLREERRKEKHEELEQLRAIREAKNLAQQEADEARAKVERERQQKILRIREAEFQERLRQLQLYQEQQKELQEKENAIKQALAEEEAMKKALQSEQNAKRVAERQKEYQEKCRLRKERQHELEKLKTAREKTLEAFFKGIEQRLGVACDPERVMRGTASSMQSEAFVPFAEAARYVLHGYSEDDVQRDPRFRLQLALLEAGLHKTAYGREVITQGYRVAAAQQPSGDNPFSLNF
ncbi:hypothetical protein TRVL_05139 [Trypanosoma vivax]|uniref:Uncharacterized protein n=1 Tax=Trypanosoma vivax (strain Y486) TaxID=1055687 RepID=G0U150_TRYVY|nr:hypothetical protein TRVL_05139 [Trypanosoma vivax]CCC49805.1 conserved hypothetical protein [Trypanosoma vivax Y486]